MADNVSVEEFLATAVDAAKKAGEIIRKGFYQTKHVEHKGQVVIYFHLKSLIKPYFYFHFHFMFLYFWLVAMKSMFDEKCIIMINA